MTVSLLNFEYNVQDVTISFSKDHSDKIYVSFGGNDVLSYSDLLAKIMKKSSQWNTDIVYFTGADEVLNKNKKSLIFLISTLEYLGKKIYLSANRMPEEILSIYKEVEDDPNEIQQIVDHWSGPVQIKTYKPIYARPSFIISDGKGLLSNLYSRTENNEYELKEKDFLYFEILPLEQTEIN